MSYSNRTGRKIPGLLDKKTGGALRPACLIDVFACAYFTMTLRTVPLVMMMLRPRCKPLVFTPERV